MTECKKSTPPKVPTTCQPPTETASGVHTCDQRINSLAAQVDLGRRSAVSKRVVAQLSECQLAVVAVGAEVFHAMESLTEATEGFGEVRVLPGGASGAVLEGAAEVDAASEAESEIAGAGSPVAILVGDVVLHAGAHVDLKLLWVDWAPKSLIKLASVFPIGVAQGIVDVLSEVSAPRFFPDLVQGKAKKGDPPFHGDSMERVATRR